VASGTVKWYDPEKGFGFIEQDGGGQDIFVHRSAVGYEGLNEGDRVEFEVGYGQKGANAVGVSVTEKSALPARPRRSAFDGGVGRSGGFAAPPADVSGLPQLAGVVKRYDAEKGYGFIAQDGGDEDVFVHRSALGFEEVAPGDRVEFRLGRGPKGARAEQVRVVERGTAPVSGGRGRDRDWSSSGGYDDYFGSSR
jgi:cold shock protein